MKKVYSKPDIYFEDFSLSTNIAAGCDIKVITGPNNKYGFQFGDQYLFTTVCTDVVKNDDWNGLCYHNPTESSNVFNS